MSKRILFITLFLYTVFVYGDTQYWINDVIFNNGNFIATGSDNYLNPVVKVSQDGITWKNSYIDNTNSDSAQNQIFGISCNKNICVGALSMGKNVLYSNDNGLTWKYVYHGFNNFPDGAVANGEYKFVIATSNNILYSYDGLTWHKANLPARSQGYSFNGHLAYGNHMFLTMTVTDTSLLASSDGINWYIVNTTNTPISKVYQLTSIIFVDKDKAFYFGSNTFNGLIYSSDLTNYWTKNPTQEFAYLEYHNNIMFVTVNSPPSGPYVNALSYDLGYTWGPSIGNRGPAIMFNHFAYGNNVYVYINSDAPQYSSDAINWFNTKL